MLAPFFFSETGLVCMHARSILKKRHLFWEGRIPTAYGCTCTVPPAPALTSTLSMRVGFHLLQDIALLPLLSHGRIIFFISLHFNLSRSIDVARLVITSYICGSTKRRQRACVHRSCPHPHQLIDKLNRKRSITLI